MRFLQKRRGKSDTVNAVAFSPDDTLLAAVGGSAFQRDGEWSGRGELNLWDRISGERVATFKVNDGTAQSVAFAPDGQTLAVGTSAGTVLLWDASNKSVRATLSGHTHPVVSVAFSPDGKWLMSAAGNRSASITHGGGQLKIWDAHTGTLQDTCWESGVLAVAFAPDRSRLVVTSDCGWSIHLCHPETAKGLRELNPQRIVRTAKFSPDGKTLAAGGAREIQLWDLETAKMRAKLKGHKGNVTSVDFNTEGTILMSASTDGTVRLWDPANETEREVFEWGFDNVQCVAIAGDGMSAAAGGKGEHTLLIWDVMTKW